ncbi:hypothetical protein [Devosia sp.]|uniref:MotE family protein n=1 Tax=Devosia sp. TaxID=1871048 RepID=UPI002AFDE43F|nr:hypothetical protein [Devosia sp.]
MTRIRLLPVVVVAIAALLVLKTLGLVTNGGYVLAGTSLARAAESEAAGGDGAMAAEPTLTDTTPTLADETPTLPQAVAEPAPEGVAAASIQGVYCVDADATLTESGEALVLHAAGAEGEDHGAEAVAPAPQANFATTMTTDCLPSGDAVPMQITADGRAVPLIGPDGASAAEQQVLARLAARRAELQKYEEELALRSSIVDAAEKRIEERAATLEALESQISALVDQRQQMESGNFAGIVAMYETMRPKDAANIFNNLDMEVLLHVAKTMSPRKMAPIMAQMEAKRAQELTVRMAALAELPPTELTPADLAALPQIVGQ